MFGLDDYKSELTESYEDQHTFTVSFRDKELAWAQWSPLYGVWRVLFCQTGELHYVSDEDAVIDVCAAWLQFHGIDRVDNTSETD